MEQEKYGLKEELERVEQEKIDAENEITGLSHNLNLAETSRERLERDITALSRYSLFNLHCIRVDTKIIRP